MALSIAENLVVVKKRLKRAARKAGRDTSEITLIAVTKTIEAKRVKEAIKEGLRVFGESYMQEAQEKIKKIGDKKKKWHFVGHLQKNKARFAVELFDCIHSVDTPGLAREINRRTPRPIDVLIQVNISGEKTKHGTTPEGAIEIARLIGGLKNLNFRGLMAIPPAVDVPERSRPYFITLRRLAERINRERIPGIIVHDLSMGMSADFDIAIEEGATMVRVGTSIFGPREPAEQKAPAKKAVEKKAAKAPLKEGKKTPLKKKPASTKVAAGKSAASKKTTDKKTKPVITKKPVAKAKKTATGTKKSPATAKKTAPKEEAVKKKTPIAAVKKSVAKKTAVSKKSRPTAKKKTAPATKKAPAKATAKVKKTAVKKTKSPEAPQKTAVKKKAVSAAKKTTASRATAKKAAPVATKKKAPKATAVRADKNPPAKKNADKKTKKSVTSKKSS